MLSKTRALEEFGVLMIAIKHLLKPKGEVGGSYACGIIISSRI